MVYVSPDRGRIKRKWSVDKENGPLVMAAELVLKKLIQHSWPCEYRADREGGICYARFRAVRGRQIGPDFSEALERACRIVGADHRVTIACDGVDMWLDGDYYINRAGKLAKVPA